MIGESNKERGRLKGYMWECVILRFLNENNFDEIASVDNVRLRRDREQFLEMRGRGTWHQIDCPCDYRHFIPFINPLRILGEVKFLTVPVSKDLIREFIGTIKDIQENYFVPHDFSLATTRYTELGVYFSANGFSQEAERLAFAHNIKTISHVNIELLDSLKKIIIEIERDYLDSENCLSAGNQRDFIQMFKELLRGSPGDISDFKLRFNAEEGFEAIAADLINAFSKIKSNFVASSSGGALLHFIGADSFPEDLFADTDVQLCRVHYEPHYRRKRFFLDFSRDILQRRYYFCPPISLAKAAFFEPNAVLNEKKRIFRSIQVARNIRGISRTLKMELDMDWLDTLMRNQNG
jgi:hypothetical protein